MTFCLNRLTNRLTSENGAAMETPSNTAMKFDTLGIRPASPLQEL